MLWLLHFEAICSFTLSVSQSLSLSVSLCTRSQFTHININVWRPHKLYRNANKKHDTYDSQYKFVTRRSILQCNNKRCICCVRMQRAREKKSSSIQSAQFSRWKCWAMRILNAQSVKLYLRKGDYSYRYNYLLIFFSHSRSLSLSMRLPCKMHSFAIRASFTCNTSFKHNALFSHSNSFALLKLERNTHANTHKSRLWTESAWKMRSFRKLRL